MGLIANIIEEDIQTCRDCAKAQSITPNKKSQLARCNWDGEMKNKDQEACGAFKKSNKPESAWEPQ